MGAPACANLIDQAFRHTQQPQPLARRSLERCVAIGSNRQILRLGAAPGRNQQIGDGRACAHHIARRAGVDPLHEARGAGLNDSDVALVEVEGSGGVEALGEDAALDARQTNAQTLKRPRIDGDARTRCRAFVGVAGNELHIHERRLARLVEVLLGLHRVVPVEGLAACRRRRGRGWTVQTSEAVARYARDQGHEHAGGAQPRGGERQSGH